MATVTVSDTQTVGQRLGTARKLVNIDQTTMGALVGASRPTISAWERDEREPSFSQVVRWAEITGQSLEWLAEGVHAKAPAEAGADVRHEGFEPPTF